MKKFRTIVSVIVMCLAGIAGFFLGSVLDAPMGGSDLVFDDRRNCLCDLCDRKSGFVIGKIRR